MTKKLSILILALLALAPKTQAQAPTPTLPLPEVRFYNQLVSETAFNGYADQLVTLSAVEGAQIHYSINGYDPRAYNNTFGGWMPQASQYVEPFTLKAPGTYTLKVVALSNKQGFVFQESSEILEIQVTLSAGYLLTVVSDPPEAAGFDGHIINMTTSTARSFGPYYSGFTIGVSSTDYVYIDAFIVDDLVDGYNFKGWYKDGEHSSGDHTYYISGFNETELTLTAKYKLILVLYDTDTENDDKIASNVGKEMDVKLKRTLYARQWNTLCLPFALTDFERTPLANATVKELVSSSYEASTKTLTLNFSTVSKIEAGKPYIVKWASGNNIKDPEFEDVVISSDAASTVETDYIDFVGCYSPVSLAAQNRTVLFMGNDSKLYYPSSDVSVNASRGYFQLKNDLTAGDLPTGGAKSIVLNFGDETTGLPLNPSPNREGSNTWFDLSGRNLSGKPTAKGVYIKNGRKIVVK